MHGVPTIIALVYNEDCESPGYFGEPGLEGYGEVVPGEPRIGAAALIRPLLKDPSFASGVAAERGRRAPSRTIIPMRRRSVCVRSCRVRPSPRSARIADAEVPGKPTVIS
jgi:hypothetical protein